MLPEFRNEPFSQFSHPDVRAQMIAAIEAVKREQDNKYPLYIDGEAIATEKLIESINPSRKEEIVGRVYEGTAEHAQRAIAGAARAFTWWSKKSFAERARYLFKAAAIMRRRKFELSATMVLEAGKTWAEADADTAEAIDFLEFYAREAIRLGEPQPLTRIREEDNELYYIPLGVGAIITPWNFPLAILTGMTTSAIVAGNTVVLKPAMQTPVIAAKFMEVMKEAGVPAGVIQFVPGAGETVGEALVDHPQTRFISFTGSRRIGCRIYERAAKVQPGQIWLKRVIAEMGGKDAIVVDEHADLDDAARQIVASAFHFAGQKCSACSRAILHESIYDEMVERLLAITKDLRVGEADNADSQVGPVIDEGAFQKVMSYIEIGQGEGTLLCGGKPASEHGYFIEPTIFGDVQPTARIAQEEIFGPVLALIKAGSFEEAIDIANGTDYGLTGSVFSRDRDHLEYARVNFQVGNLYFNRKSTGALVGVHPFGGFNMSGTDSKAGGRDYLLQFTQAKAVSERL
ncbi:delta-1-pyrroline-5-carboxylate dehydrogenase [Alicyclobacillus hesperidum URH17-3-68]|uniref:L-glutamate gamma-semialdehyde dehydrogenase n=1 Tax=Alicyclobacillus hesperidum TaxID=89784 RepID=A0AA37U1X4_9BACL|nr:L-glutamate gamma-semialdehyde dehydrogenase [Alicyclobacillus hesperidum]EJY54517.1 delta-1-pyrroline-5-carboxylate dehydrogenase [Alicyclobacillus hesperidum URH17-3-68]GLV13106.1 1-pyrroline-5-carboxylate dehydrogenase [Alicyclobacillus hesperidum]